jgi:surfactin synthase thioesterase subunit
MVPPYITPMEALPLTRNGKIDRKILRGTDEQYEVRKDKVLPTTEMEAKLYTLWKEVLGGGDFGIDDNFFDLGGDSFKAIRIASKYGQGSLVLTLYKNPTVRRLAHFLSLNTKVTYLQEITTDRPGKTINCSVIAVPNSGGDAVTFAQTASHLETIFSDASFYGVALPRTEPGETESMQVMVDNLVQSLMIEIKEKVKGPIIIYGQCNGVALALELASKLEAEQVVVKAICAGAKLPLLRKYPENEILSDDEKTEFLKSMGATIPENPAERIIFFRNWTYDSRMAIAVFNKFVSKIKKRNLRKFDAPLYCIVGDQDPLTKGYLKKYRDWFHYANTVSLVPIKNVGHYIARDQPKELASIFAKIALDQPVSQPTQNVKGNVLQKLKLVFSLTE